MNCFNRGKMNFRAYFVIFICLGNLVAEQISSPLKVNNQDIINMKVTDSSKNVNIDEMKSEFIQHQQQAENVKVKPSKGMNLGFIHAFVASLSVIIVSELGDKTFFIAAIMAMRHSRITVFMGAILALSVMTVLSAVLGFATSIIPRIYTYYVSTALFALFGLKMLREGYYMSSCEGQEEYEEVQANLRKQDEELEKTMQNGSVQDIELGIIRSYAKSSKKLLFIFISRIFLQSFTMTFLAEWGDRSQLATIILAARENVVGVTLGGVLGHALCTLLAVLGGRFIAQKISVKTVTLIGGFVFLGFAVSAFFINSEA